MTNETDFQEKKPAYYILDNCTRCGRCAQKCPLHALVPRQGHYRIDLRARWCLSSGKMLERIQDSLSRDYPVILAVGQNIPFWKKKKLTFYRQENGVYLPNTIAGR